MRVKIARSAVNYLIISILVFMAGLAAVFVYINYHLKSELVLGIVGQTEFASELIELSTDQIMSSGHGERYRAVMDYGELIGVDEIGIFAPDGTEAAFAGTLGRSVHPWDAGFQKALRSGAAFGQFDPANGYYTRYVPLKAEGACAACHSDKEAALGILMLRLSTENGYGLLGKVQNVVWILAAIALFPVAGLIIAGAVIKEKNRLFVKLKESNKGMERTYNELNNTKYYLQMILDNSRAVIITTDTNRKIVEFNKEAEALLEYPKEEIAGKDVLMLYIDPVQRAMAGGDELTEGEVWAVRNREVKLKSKSGKVVHLSLTLSTMVNDYGRIIGTVGVGKDISEQKMLQFKLLQAEKLAGIGTLATGIAHEINNPLAGILGMAEAIRDEEDMPVIKSYADDIIRYSEDARKIVRELSDYSRSAQHVSESEVELSGIIENSLKMGRHSVSFKNIKLNTDLGCGCRIKANPLEIQQVMVNLVVNAVHSMGEDGTLSIRCWTDDGSVKIQVSDTGHGIPEKNLRLIFDPFFTTKPVGAGTGLGLYVVYKIVTKFGGTIDVESGEGRGTTFTLRFPLPDLSDELSR